LIKERKKTPRVNQVYRGSGGDHRGRKKRKSRVALTIPEGKKAERLTTSPYPHRTKRVGKKGEIDGKKREEGTGVRLQRTRERREAVSNMTVVEGKENPDPSPTSGEGTERKGKRDSTFRSGGLSSGKKKRKLVNFVRQGPSIAKKGRGGSDLAPFPAGKRKKKGQQDRTPKFRRIADGGNEALGREKGPVSCFSYQKQKRKKGKRKRSPTLRTRPSSLLNTTKKIGLGRGGKGNSVLCSSSREERKKGQLT